MLHTSLFHDSHDALKLKVVDFRGVFCTGTNGTTR